MDHDQQVNKAEAIREAIEAFLRELVGAHGQECVGYSVSTSAGGCGASSVTAHFTVLTERPEGAAGRPMPPFMHSIGGF